MKRLAILLACPLVLMVALTNCARSGATPAAQDGTIILTGFETDAAGRKLPAIRALSARDGTTLWTTVVGHANWAPIVVGNVIYAIVMDPIASEERVVAMRVSDGKVLWRSPIATNGFNAIVAADDTVIAVANSRDGLDAFNPTDGSRRWHLGGVADDQPIVRNGIVYLRKMTGAIDLPGVTEKLAIPEKEEHLLALRGSDGKLLWNVSIPTLTDQMMANERTIFGASWAPVLGMTAIDRSTGQSFKSPAASAAWASAEHGRVLGATDAQVFLKRSDLDSSRQLLVALSAADGHLLWESTVSLDAPLSGKDESAPINDGLIYGTNSAHEVVAVHTSDGNVAWHVRTADSGYHDICTTGDVIVDLSDLMSPENRSPKLTVLDGRTGAVLWRQGVPWAQQIAKPVQIEGGNG